MRGVGAIPLIAACCGDGLSLGRGVVGGAGEGEGVSVILRI